MCALSLYLGQTPEFDPPLMANFLVEVIGPAPAEIFPKEAMVEKARENLETEGLGTEVVAPGDLVTTIWLGRKYTWAYCPYFEKTFARDTNGDGIRVKANA